MEDFKWFKREEEKNSFYTFAVLNILKLYWKRVTGSPSRCGVNQTFVRKCLVNKREKKKIAPITRSPRMNWMGFFVVDFVHFGLYRL